MTPLAIAMVAGPQMIVATFLIANKNRYRYSLAYILSIGIAMIIGLTISVLVTKIFVNIPKVNDNIIFAIQILCVVYLIYSALKTIKNRDYFETPKWQKKLLDPTFKMIFKISMVLILVVPIDVVILFSVGLEYNKGGYDIMALIVLLLLVMLFVSIPLLLTTIFHRRADKHLEKLPHLIEEYSWIVNVIVYLIFVFLIWP